MNYIELATLVCRKAIGNKLFNYAAEGNVAELNDKTIKDYPAFMMTGVGPHLDYGGRIDYRVSFFYFDRLLEDNSNSTQIYSNGISALQNLINALKADSNILDISDTVEYVPFLNPEAQVLSDRTAGVYANLTISVANNTECYIA